MKRNNNSNVIMMNNKTDFSYPINVLLKEMEKVNSMIEVSQMLHENPGLDTITAYEEDRNILNEAIELLRGNRKPL